MDVKVLCLQKPKIITFLLLSMNFHDFPLFSRLTIPVLAQLYRVYNHFLVCLVFFVIVHSDNGKCFVSKKINEFFNQRGIASTFSSVYNPRGNSQCERFNGIIWNTIKLALRTYGLEIANCEMVMPEVLHSLQSLLCTAMNEVPHNRFLKFPCCLMFGNNTSIWMTEPGPVHVRKHVRDKYNPVVRRNKFAPR